MLLTQGKQPWNKRSMTENLMRIISNIMITNNYFYTH